MKDKVLTILRSLSVLFLLTILFSLIFSALYNFHVISSNTFSILHWVFGVLAYMIAGVILGVGINKKALLHAFCISLVIAFIGFLVMDTYTLMNSIEFISKLLFYNIGSVLALNLQSKH